MYKRTILILLVLAFMSGKSLAFGELTHYSIDRDAGKNTIDEISAASAPDAFANLLYGTNDLDGFVHAELPGVLYDPLGPYINPSWNNGWMGHTISDRSSHGTYLPNSPYINPDNYLYAVGASSLLDHYEAEFAGDILSYWNKKGTLPTSVTIYPRQLGDAISSYDKSCGTKYKAEYNSQDYLKSYESLYTSTYAEQAIIDYKLDKKLQFSDYGLLTWAKNKYSVPFDKYYGDAVVDVKNNVNSAKTCLQNGLTSNINSNSQSEKIKIEKMKTDAGKQLIDKGLIKLHEKIDDKTGSVTISLEPINNDQIVKEYINNLENIYEKQTGKKIKVLEDILSR